MKIKSRNEFGFSPDTEMGLMRTFDAYYQDQPKIIENEKKSLYNTFGNNKGIYKFNSLYTATLKLKGLVELQNKKSLIHAY